MEYMTNGVTFPDFRTVCFEYESIQAFLDDFKKAVIVAREKYESMKNVHDEWQKSEPSFLKDKKGWLQWSKLEPDNGFCFTFAGAKFELYEFGTRDKLQMPNVMELDEWFEKNKPKPNCYPDLARSPAEPLE